MKKKILFLIVFLGAAALFAQKNGCTIILSADMCRDTISQHIYGQFAEHLGRGIYGGVWVGENSSIPNTRGIRNDVVNALKKIEIPNVRWPGGCFADEYHWMDGIGPRDKRPTMVNTHWGGVVEDNSFGTHEFMDFCEQLGTEPYITGNVGSGTVREMSEWVEYITSDGDNPMSKLRKQNGRENPWKVKFWGVGNENWGCGGNMTPEFYADQYKRYATYCRNYGDNRLLKIACGGYGEDYNWNETMMKKIPASLMGGVSLHYYTLPKDWSDKGSATEFDETEYAAVIQKCMRIDEFITKHSAIMDKYDPDRKIGLMVDEWGNWYNVEPGTNPGFLYQQNTLRDAISAAVNLNIFNNHCGRVKLANIAQMVNVLQSLILTDGPKMILTPTYYVYDLYKYHHDAALIPADIKTPAYEYDGKTVPAVSVSASKNKEGVIHITLVNVNPDSDINVNCEIDGVKISEVNGKILSSGKVNDHNTFENPDAVKPAEFAGAKISGGKLDLNLPSKSVVMLEVK